MTTQNTSNSWLRHTLPVLTLVVVALAILLIPRLSSGQEVEQTGLRPLPPGQEDDSYVVPADATVNFGGSPQVISMASFVGTGEDTGSYQTTFDGWINSKAANTQVCYVAPVYLPDGATITAMDAYYIDNTDFLMEIYLNRKPYLAGAPQGILEMARVYSDPSGVTPSPNVVHRVDSTINQPLVDNNTYHYYITACPWHPEHKIQSVRVFFSQ